MNDVLSTYEHFYQWEGLEFRGCSDEKMRRIWLGREIVVLSLPPLNTHMPCCKYIFLETDNFSKLLCVPNALVKSKKNLMGY